MTQVAIIGMGPTGLTMAHLLGQRGISTTIIERDEEFYGRARAVYTDDECLRILQSAGVADEVASRMIQDCPAQWMLPDGAVLAQYNRVDRPNGWPVNNFLYQPWLENRMEEL